MKKFRLLAIAFAAIFSSSSLFAQVDVTDMYITNPTLAQSANGWTYGKTGNGNNPATRTADVPVLEFYNAWSGNAGGSVAEQNFYVYQNVSLPAGQYRLQLYGFYREGNGTGENKKAYVYVGGQKQYLEALTSANVSAYSGNDDLDRAANAFKQGDFFNVFDFELAEAATVELGVRGVINTYCSWCVVGGMKLYSFADADALLTEAKEALQGKIDAAESLLKTYSSSDAWYGDLNSAITTANGKLNSSNIDEINAAASALSDAMLVAEDAAFKSTWADIADGKYYIQNKEAGKWLSNGANWGTRAVLYGNGIVYSFTKGNDGKYTLTSNIKAAGKALRPTDGFNDQSGAWVIIKTKNAGEYYLYDSENGRYFAYDGTNIPQFVDAPNANCVWTFATPEQRKQVYAGADVTTYLKCPDFITNDINNGVSLWNGSPSQAGNGSGNCAIANSYNAEKFGTAAFTVSQTVEVPNGLYRVTCQGFYRGENPSQLFANDASVDLKSVYSESKEAAEGGWADNQNGVFVPNTQAQAAECFETGAYVNTLNNVYVKDGVLTLGVKHENDEESNVWTLFDTFTLTYVRALTADELLSPEELAAAELANAKTAKNTAIDALSPIGTGFFTYSASDIEAAKAAVEVATTVAEVEAVELPVMNTPEAGKAYALKNTTADGYLTIGSSITVTKYAPVYFEAVNGGYVLANENKEYIYKTTNNYWTLSSTTNKDEAYVLTVGVVNGGYTLTGANNGPGTAGIIGSDATASGSTFYADKTAEKNGVWTIEEYEEVDPAQELADAKAAKTTAIKALTPVGSAIFQYSSNNVAAALQAVEAATTIDEVEAVAMPKVNAPAANKAYQLTSPNGNFIVINEGVKMADVQQPIYFAQNADGKFTISTNGNGNGTEYVVSVTSDGNYWSLTDAKGEGTAYSIVAADGGITIQAESKFFGFDNDEVGASLYRDKAATVFGIAEYVEPKPVIADLTVNDGFAVEASAEEKNITYVREFKSANKWQSLYLPFSVNLENNTADVVLAKVDDVVADADGVVINIVKVSTNETVEARKPLFIAAKTVGVKNINTGVSTISEPNDGGNEYSAAEFIGVLSEARAGYAGKYVMSGGELCLVPQSMDNLTLGVNRWAMFVSNGMGVRVRINAEGFNADEATAIASAVAESVENGEIFSVNGAKVKDAKSGLYIKGGKKVLVK